VVEILRLFYFLALVFISVIRGTPYLPLMVRMSINQTTHLFLLKNRAIEEEAF